MSMSKRGKKMSQWVNVVSAGNETDSRRQSISLDIDLNHRCESLSAVG
jgi:hypothetical protein